MRFSKTHALSNAVALAATAFGFASGPAAAAERALHAFDAVTISPDGSRVAAVESDEPAVEGAPARQRLVIRTVDGSSVRAVALSCDPSTDCVPSSPVWSPDSSRLAFVVTLPKSTMRTLYSVDRNGETRVAIFRFNGTLVDPRFSRQGTLAVLATAGARKEVGATQAGAPIVGEIGAAADEQRIAVVAPGGRYTWASPPDMFVYEFDWRPDASGFVGTAAHGNGDNNWWIAHLYSFARSGGAASELYAPANARQQLADPRISPDGTSVAFIAGIMSDFGSTGGDVYVLPLNGPGAAPVDVTPNFAGSATSLAWRCGSNVLQYSALLGPRSTISSLGISGNGTSAAAPRELWSGTQSHYAENAAFSQACRSPRSAAVVTDFEHPPEIEVGEIGAWKPLTHANDGIAPETLASSVTWKSEGYTVDGWLLAPLHVDAAPKHPLITLIHGGPSAASRPAFFGRGTARAMLRKGYYLFYPNPRGSYGGGEAFTLANVKDFGHGDLRDVLAGVDAVEKIAPIDDARLGIAGVSYGGFMTMWAVTQTHRFKAGVAGAGISNWISYYGQNGIDEWMIPFFGASAYDDPAVYRQSSPIEYIKNVTTPTFAYVGERDVECPAPQSLEFWHALRAINVPTQLVIYAGEGHGIRAPKNRADVTKRTLDWFDRYLR